MADTEHYGPALPPAAAASSEGSPAIIGPAIPPGFIKEEAGSQQREGSEENSSTVAALGSGSTQGTEASTSAGNESNMGEVGPMVSEMSHGDEVVQAAEEFERRSRKMKDHLTIKAEAEPGPSKREEWMTELPPEMGKNIGITARTFSKGAGSDDKDRSDWTDTPADKIKKEKEGKNKKRKREEEKTTAKPREQQLQQQIDEYNKKKRPESLVEMHQKSKKKKKKKEAKKKKKDKKKGKEEKEERRPFDRDQDLKVNKFDEAQRQAIIKRSAMLNTRFQHGGSTSSFL